MGNKAVVLGANYYIGLSIIRCLGEHGIKVAAVDYKKEGSYGLHSRYLSEALLAPHYKEDPEALLQFLIDYAKGQDKPPVLYPSADPYVEFVDKYLDLLSEYYLLPSIEKGLYTKVMNKESLHSLALKHGVKVPETLDVNEDDFWDQVDRTMTFPCIVKPTDSPAFVAVFRKKLFIVENKDQLKEAIEKAKEAGLEVIVQRIIPGFDDHMYTFDAHLNKDSKVTHWLTCQKHRQYPINFGASVYTEQKYVKELYDIGAPFLEAIGWKGFAEIEFKKDAETGEYYLIEINVRTTNLNSLLRKAGLNFPFILYKELTDKPLEPKAVTRDTGLVFWYAFEDILAVKGYLKTRQLSFGRVFKSYFKKKAYAIWSIRDPKPALAFLVNKLGRVFRKIFKRK